MHKDEAYIGMKVQRRYPSKRTATANVEKGVIKEIFRAMLKDKWLVLVDWEDGIPRIIALGYLRNRQEEEKETTEMTEEALADKYKMHGLRYWDYMGSRLREEATHKTAGYTYLSSSILDAMMTRINALEHRCSELEWDSFGEPDMEDPQLELDV